MLIRCNINDETYACTRHHKLRSEERIRRLHGAHATTKVPSRRVLFSSHNRGKCESIPIILFLPAFHLGYDNRYGIYECAFGIFPALRTMCRLLLPEFGILLKDSDLLKNSRRISSIRVLLKISNQFLYLPSLKYQTIVDNHMCNKKKTVCWGNRKIVNYRLIAEESVQSASLNVKRFLY